MSSTTGTTETKTTATAAASPSAASAPAVTPGTAEACEARARIDELDAQIIALVQERRAVSARIQQNRAGSGGRRVHLAREMEILDHYRTALGRPGTQLAMTLLGLCRGQQ